MPAFNYIRGFKKILTPTQSDFGTRMSPPNDNMQKPVSISIGIPAHNEEQNIATLLCSLLNQKSQDFSIEEIIVLSDGSTDKTVESVQGVIDPRIRLIVSNNKRGKCQSQNKIAQSAKGDILILLDADILPNDNYFIQNIIAPFKHDSRIGLVGADTKSVKPRKIFESIIASSHHAKRNLYCQMNGGDNIYLCHGRARAFTRALYEKIRWPDQLFSEDAFSYLFCLQNGFLFRFAKDAQILFRSPSTLKDYLIQSRRFWNDRKKLENYFSPNFVKNSFRIPTTLMLRKIILSFLRSPLSAIAYFVIVAISYLSRRSADTSENETAKSSKMVEV